MRDHQASTCRRAFKLMGKKRQKPEHRKVIFQVRPDGEGPAWWPKRDGEFAFVSIDPYEPPGWSIGDDDDYQIDSLELWEQMSTTLGDYLEHIKGEWNEEHGPDEDDEDDKGFLWEFKVLPR